MYEAECLRFTNWNKVTPRHNAFVQKILQSHFHIISTIRTKTDYTLTDKNGKMVPKKVELKGITRDGMDYEFIVVFNLCISTDGFNADIKVRTVAELANHEKLNIPPSIEQFYLLISTCSKYDVYIYSQRCCK